VARGLKRVEFVEYTIPLCGKALQLYLGAVPGALCLNCRRYGPKGWDSAFDEIYSFKTPATLKILESLQDLCEDVGTIDFRGI